MRIPQADDIIKIMDLPLAIAENIDTSKLVAARYGFDERQSNYYLEAAEVLGLITKRGTKYRLTEDGKKYLLMDISCHNRKSTRLNSSHSSISYAVFCLKKKIPVQNNSRL